MLVARAAELKSIYLLMPLFNIIVDHLALFHAIVSYNQLNSKSNIY